ncbi:hypothetical protein CC80DRAFT_318242 [Byssothecium circinans]|uniref:Uncharacterized protein n=1 Tax=Byssothecium circinans TaxID=147558 RepID=A0A6A5T6L4_9PLEO|nr:hypothetical protein CC80DRAFT_329642 [Byssothecium circinans]KAF1948283.1 hypothetical protein CC80DRAFT_318242 [Byssothecium circinans]
MRERLTKKRKRVVEEAARGWRNARESGERRPAVQSVNNSLCERPTYQSSSMAAATEIDEEMSDSGSLPRHASRAALTLEFFPTSTTTELCSEKPKRLDHAAPWCLISSVFPTRCPLSLPRVLVAYGYSWLVTRGRWDHGRIESLACSRTL